MIDIDESELVVLEAERLGGFLHRLCSFLRGGFDVTLGSYGDAELLQKVKQLVKFGQDGGLRVERDLALYAIAGIVLGEEFPMSYPDLSELLLDTEQDFESRSNDLSNILELLP